MQKTIHFIPLILAIFLFISISHVYGDELDDINKEINDLTNAYNQSKVATAPLESQLNDVKQRVAFIEADLIKKKREIDNGYKNLGARKEIFDKTVAKHYIESYNNNWLSYLVGSQATGIIQSLVYQKAKADQDKVIITNIALSITDLEEKKINLESEEIKLAATKIKLDEIVTEAKAYQATLSSKIAALTAQQQQILNQRLSALGIPRSAGTALSACVDDRDKDPGFSPRLAFFTYGVPNRTGLNQYGAQGRANAGQQAEQILSSYYANYELKKDYDTTITINVEGYGGYNIEDYVKRIYEMPNSFHSEALKAQAIAARSYALSYTNNGAGSICTTEKCQVFKPDPKGGSWEQAVNDTRGWVMVQGGSPVKAWYSSTHGGYILSTSELPGWSDTSWTKHATDTTTGAASDFGDLGSNAYDKESPWFYCDWGSRTQYNKTAWLRGNEVADIVNIILLAQQDSSTKEKLYQTDKSHPYGGEVWNEERVKSELRTRGITPFNNISDVSIGADFGSGKTISVNVTGDAGSRGFNGSEFKDWFNLRAPANIQIVGPLYNAEKR